MSETIPGYYDTAGAMEVLKVSGSGVSKIAKSECWPTLKVGNSHLYHAADIQEYHDHQARTELVKVLGWKGRGLYRYDGIDISCPICEVFAIMAAPPNLPKTYLCLNGHKGDIDEIETKTI